MSGSPGLDAPQFARVGKVASCPTCGGTGFVHVAHGSGRQDIVGLSIVSSACPDCGGDGKWHKPTMIEQRISAAAKKATP